MNRRQRQVDLQSPSIHTSYRKVGRKTLMQNDVQEDYLRHPTVVGFSLNRNQIFNERRKANKCQLSKKIGEMMCWEKWTCLLMRFPILFNCSARVSLGLWLGLMQVGLKSARTLKLWLFSMESGPILKILLWSKLLLKKSYRLEMLEA